MQNDSANTTQLVELQGKLKKKMHTETKVIEKKMTILKDNVDKLYLKEEVVQMRDTHNTHDQSTNALQDMFRNEMEKMWNNEKGKLDQILCVVTTTFITTYKGGMEEPREEKGIEWVWRPRTSNYYTWIVTWNSCVNGNARNLIGIMQTRYKYGEYLKELEHVEEKMEKLGLLVTKKTEFIGNILPKLSEQQPTKPMLSQQSGKEDLGR